jgi:anti-sigma factor RsiW
MVEVLLFKPFQAGARGIGKLVKKGKHAAARRAARQETAHMAKLQEQTIRAQRERQRLIAERKMYEAQLAAKRERESVARTRRSTGKYTVGERASAAARGLSGASGGFSRGFTSYQPKRRR